MWNLYFCRSSHHFQKTRSPRHDDAVFRHILIPASSKSCPWKPASRFQHREVWNASISDWSSARCRSRGADDDSTNRSRVSSHLTPWRVRWFQTTATTGNRTPRRIWRVYCCKVLFSVGNGNKLHYRQQGWLLALCWFVTLNLNSELFSWTEAWGSEGGPCPPWIWNFPTKCLAKKGCSINFE